MYQMETDRYSVISQINPLKRFVHYIYLVVFLY